MIEDLYIKHQYSRLVWKNDAIEDTLWLELLLPFPAVNNLYLSKDLYRGCPARNRWDRSDAQPAEYFREGA